MLDIKAFISEPLHKSAIGKWAKTELSAVNLMEVVCLNEESVAEKYLQFQIPIEEEHNFPQEVCIHGKTVRIEHALPYATPFTTRARPPHEETVHEHWENSARLEAKEKKGHVNCVTKSEGSSGSIQRQLNLVESSLIVGSKRIICMTEVSSMPWIFFNGIVDEDHALHFFRRYMNKMAAKDDLLSVLDSNLCNHKPSAREIIDMTCMQVLRINCSDDQPLRIGFFHDGRKGWTYLYS